MLVVGLCRRFIAVARPAAEVPHAHLVAHLRKCAARTGQPDIGGKRNGGRGGEVHVLGHVHVGGLQRGIAAQAVPGGDPWLRMVVENEALPLRIDHRVAQ